MGSVPGSPGESRLGVEGKGMETRNGSLLSLKSEGSVGEGQRVGGMWSVRREAEEVGRFLEKRLEGFGLSVER
jgi:hypothetical protein